MIIEQIESRDIFAKSGWIVCCVICFALTAVPCLAKDQYWLSFVSSAMNVRTLEESPAIYLMKIDIFGNVVIRPTRVINRSTVNSGTAISHSGNGLINLWSSRLGDAQYFIIRTLIEKRTLRPLFIKKTLTSYSHSFIHVTQKGEEDFLVLQQLDLKEKLIRHEAFGLSVGGALLGKRWQLIRSLGDCGGCGNAVSADGAAYIYTDYIRGIVKDYRQVIFQHLNMDLKPSGKSKTLSTRGRVDAIDVSNIVAGGKRFILYVHNQSQVYDSLYLQAVRAWTGEPVGKRILVARQTGFRRDAVIDPDGRFVVYMRTDSLSGITYQALDVSGRPVGKPKLLVEAGGGGLDILKE